mgnify:FL=1
MRFDADRDNDRSSGRQKMILPVHGKGRQIFAIAGEPDGRQPEALNCLCLGGGDRLKPQLDFEPGIFQTTAEICQQIQ